MSEPKTYTLDGPGAVLSYDVREAVASTEPVLLIIGSPMGASGFVTLAGHFGERTVVTYDPRGAERSRRTDSTAEMTPDQHAEQVRTLVAHEPPASQELPDREAVLATCHGIRATYLSRGLGPAMAKFIALVMFEGPLLAGRAGLAVAERLGLAPTSFPGGHDGFLGGEYGGTGQPDEFAATLRTVLAS
jgi:hypothetical protein